jgi:hypothetical protein
MNQQDISTFINRLKESKPKELMIKGSKDNSPSPLHYYNSKKLFVPDVVTTFKDKKDFYAFETTINDQDISLLTFKWILFSSEARKLNGTFYLVIDKKDAAYCKAVIIDQKLNLTLIEI